MCFAVEESTFFFHQMTNASTPDLKGAISEHEAWCRTRLEEQTKNGFANTGKFLVTCCTHFKKKTKDEATICLPNGTMPQLFDSIEDVIGYIAGEKNNRSQKFATICRSVNGCQIRLMYWWCATTEAKSTGHEQYEVFGLSAVQTTQAAALLSNMGIHVTVEPSALVPIGTASAAAAPDIVAAPLNK